MAKKGTVAITVAIGGTTIVETVEREADNPQVFDVVLPPGKSGTVTTKTDADTGVATLAAGHGIQTGNTVDVFWDGGCRYGMVATVSGDAVTLEGGAGDDLPIANTVVVVTQQVTINTTIDGDLCQIVSACSTQRTHLNMRDAASATVEAITLEAAQPWLWWANSGVANPLTGNVISTTKASNGSSQTAATLQILVLQDSTP